MAAEYNVSKPLHESIESLSDDWTKTVVDDFVEVAFQGMRKEFVDKTAKGEPCSLQGTLTTSDGVQNSFNIRSVEELDTNRDAMTQITRLQAIGCMAILRRAGYIVHRRGECLPTSAVLRHNASKVM